MRRTFLLDYVSLGNNDNDSRCRNRIDDLSFRPARAVDSAYGKKSFKSGAERVAFLLEQYQERTSLLPKVVALKRRSRKPDATENPHE